MAYTLVSALVRKRAIDALWETVDLSALDINTVYATYEKVYLTLSNPLYSQPVYLDFDKVRLRIGVRVPGSTIPQWLASLGNASLPTSTSEPVIVTQTALFRDGWQAGYDAQPTDHTASPEAQLPVGSLKDLFLTKPGIDYQLLYDHALVCVDGYIHRTSTAQHGLYVLDGMSTARKVGDTQFGLLSFEQIGKLHQLPITDAMIYNQRGTELFSHFVYVNLGQSLKGKSLLFVLGGTLHCMDEAYTVIGDGLVRINIDRLPWAEIFFDCIKHLDVSSVTWEHMPNNPEQIKVSDLYSDAVIQAILQLSQTFFVLVDVPSLYLIRHYCEDTGLPGRWLSPGNVQFPLVGPMGKLIEYVPKWENTLYVLQGRAVYDENFLYETTQWRQGLTIAPNRTPRRRMQFPKTFLMELGYQFPQT